MTTAINAYKRESQYVGVVGGPTVRRCGCKFEIPAMHVDEFGYINRRVMELIHNATREAIRELMSLGVKCSFDFQV